MIVTMKRIEPCAQPKKRTSESSQGRIMFSRGSIFYTGVLLFVAGFMVPFTIRIGTGAVGVSQNTEYDILYYSGLVGTLVALLIGAPMIFIGIIMKSGRNRR